MGNLANTLFSTLLGWLRGAASWLWSFMSDPGRGGFVVWMAENWLVLVILLCAVCILIDVIVYMLRWQPYKVWGSFFRRVFGRGKKDENVGRVRRRWIHADGTTSIEVVDADEVPPEPEPRRVFPARPEEETVPEHYARFARPQQETPVEAPPAQPAAFAQADEELPEETQPPARPAGRRRRYTPAEDELPLHYTPPAVSEEAPNYHEPYYPPQWKRPADTGSSGVDLGGSGL